MNKTLKIYLAGKMSGLDFDEMNEWRSILKKKIMKISQNYDYEVLVINPVDFFNFEEYRHQSEREIRDYDLSHVVTSNLVIVNLDGLETSDGTKIEIHDANYHCKIPVIAFGDINLYENLHPWHKENITRVEKSIDNVIEYIEDFYLIS